MTELTQISPWTKDETGNKYGRLTVLEYDVEILNYITKCEEYLKMYGVDKIPKGVRL